MDSNTYDLTIDENSSEAQLSSNGSLYTDIISFPSNNSSTFIQPSLTNDSISEETYGKELIDNVHELNTDLQTRCHLDWLNNFEQSENNPKIELNLLFHDAIQEQTLKQFVSSKGIHFTTATEIIAEIFHNHSYLLQNIIQEIVSDRQQQHIIYTELLFRPDVFNFDNKSSNRKLKNVMKTLIDCIRCLTSPKLSKIEPNGVQTKTTTKSPASYSITSLPLHIKIILSCNWNNVDNMDQFIRLAREYPQEIVGIDLYGEEDDCRKYWNDFVKYTKLCRHYRIRLQATMDEYKDFQLINNVIQGLGIERLCEAYKILFSKEYMENILIKRAIHLVICPVSNAYTIANNQFNQILSETTKKSKYQSTSTLDNQQDSTGSTSYSLMNYLQTELINYCITSLSPNEYQQNLSSIYKNLLEKNKIFFTCEHMQWLNENSLKSSFASQILKTELIKCLRESYRNCYIKQFSQTTNK